MLEPTLSQKLRDALTLDAARSGAGAQASYTPEPTLSQKLQNALSLDEAQQAQEPPRKRFQGTMSPFSLVPPIVGKPLQFLSDIATIPGDVTGAAILGALNAPRGQALQGAAEKAKAALAEPGTVFSEAEKLVGGPGLASQAVGLAASLIDPTLLLQLPIKGVTTGERALAGLGKAERIVTPLVSPKARSLITAMQAEKPALSAEAALAAGRQGIQRVEEARAIRYGDLNLRAQVLNRKVLKAADEAASLGPANPSEVSALAYRYGQAGSDAFNDIALAFPELKTTGEVAAEAAKEIEPRRQLLLRAAQAQGFSPEQIQGAKDIYENLVKGPEQEFGQLLADAGAIPESTPLTFELLGGHLRRLYDKSENPAEFFTQLRDTDLLKAIRSESRAALQERYQAGAGQGATIPVRALAGRKILPTSVREELGEIEDVGQAALRGQTIAAAGIARGEALQDFARLFGVQPVKYTEAGEPFAMVAGRRAKPSGLARLVPEDDPVWLQQAKDYVFVPDQPRFGDLGGLYVPRAVGARVLGFDVLGMGSGGERLQDLLQTQRGPLGQALRLINYTKVGLIAAPSTVRRNLTGNIILAAQELGVRALDPTIWAKGFVDMAKLRLGVRAGKMPTGPLGAAMRVNPVFASGLARVDLGLANRALRLRKKGPWDVVDGVLGQTARAGGSAYSFFEEGSRAAVFYGALKSMGALANPTTEQITKAARVAERALFNYSKVPAVVEILSATGLIPFARFSYKAAEQLARKAIESPARLAAVPKVKAAIEAGTKPLTLTERQALDDDLGGYVNLPVSPGANRLLWDLRNELPYGDLVVATNALRDIEQLTHGGIVGIQASQWGDWLRIASGRGAQIPRLPGEPADTHSRLLFRAEQAVRGVAPRLPLALVDTVLDQFRRVKQIPQLEQQEPSAIRRFLSRFVGIRTISVSPQRAAQVVRAREGAERGELMQEIGKPRRPGRLMRQEVRQLGAAQTPEEEQALHEYFRQRRQRLIEEVRTRREEERAQ